MPPVQIKAMKIKILIAVPTIIILLFFINGIRISSQINKAKNISPTPTAAPVVLGNKTTQSANIETYTNKDDGYSFSYPSDMQTQIKESTLFLSKSSLVGTLDIEMTKIANPDGFTPRQFALTDSAYQRSADMKDEMINIQGVEGYKLEDNQQSVIYFPLYGNILKIGAFYKGKDSVELKNTLDKIISSFRLLEKSELNSTTGWKTYINKAAQISFSYPPNFIPDTTEYNNEKRIIYLKKIDAPEPFYQIEIRLLDNFEKASSEELATREIDKYPPLKKSITQESIRVGEADAIKVVGLPGKFQKIDIFVGVSDKEYLISLNPYDPTLFPKFYPEATNLFYQFLSTVKFQ